MHLKRQCFLLMVLCSMGVLGFPRDTDHQTAKRDAEREKDGSDSQARTLELKMNKAHPPYVSIHQQVFFSMKSVSYLRKQNSRNAHHSITRGLFVHGHRNIDGQHLRSF